jgi:hypothetical protein
MLIVAYRSHHIAKRIVVGSLYFSNISLYLPRMKLL